MFFSTEIMLQMEVHSLVYQKHFNKHLVSINNVQKQKTKPQAHGKANKPKKQNRIRHPVT